MTRSTRIYGKVALLMAGILAASVLLTLAVGVDRRPAGKTRIVASFYPVYIAALNLADGVEGVAVSYTHLDVYKRQGSPRTIVYQRTLGNVYEENHTSLEICSGPPDGRLPAGRGARPARRSGGFAL